MIIKITFLTLTIIILSTCGYKTILVYKDQQAKQKN